ncbi:MAG: hypothetical protein AAFQ94_15640 [Bacteroidota bacterium]
MYNFKELKENLIDSFKIVNTISLELFELNGGLPLERIKRTFDKFSITYNDEILNFYSQLNGVHIEWEFDYDQNFNKKRFKKDRSSVKGSIVIPTLDEFLEEESQTYLSFWEAKLVDYAKDDLMNLRCIDYGWPYWLVGVPSVGNKIITDQIFYLYQDDEDFSSCECSITNYWSKCLEFRGIEFWEEILIYGDGYSSKEKEIKHHLNEIFSITS